jgi:hypothetical protein
MTVTTINGFVLVPHVPNWAGAAAAKRVWETEIAEALPGSETRQALRAVPRRQVTFSVTTNNLEERVRLEARMDAAKVSGLACAAMHGRSCLLGTTANAGTASLALSQTAWTWAVGDYAILILNDTTFDLQKVTGLSNGGMTLGLAGNLTNKWIAGNLVWPVIFGAFTSDKESALTTHHGNVKLTIAELTSSRSVQLGNAAALPPGVGAQRIGATNKIA